MELEQQVVSLELAKKMKELGFKQESYFYWLADRAAPIQIHHIPKSNLPFDDEVDIFYSAYTVAELGEMLPFQAQVIKQITEDKYCGCYETGEECNECSEPLVNRIKETISKTEANARAKMLVYLKENGLLPEIKA